MAGAPPPTTSRWTSLEFLLYYAVISRAYFALAATARELSSRLANQLPGVRAGLLPGTFVDVSDAQWRSFRSALPLLLLVAAASAGLLRLCRAGTPAATAAHVALGSLYAAYLFGGKALPLSLLLGTSFASSRAVAGTRAGAPLIWLLNCGALALVQRHGSRPLRALHPSLAPLDALPAALRWDTCFNLTVLRLLSFGLDLHWQRSGWGRAKRGTESCVAERALAELPLPAEAYSLRLFLAYTLYPPLLVAGPIITFNAFAAQLLPAAALPPAHAALAATLRPSAGGVAVYALRWLGLWACLELQTHWLHANSLAVSGAWRGSIYAPPFTPRELGAVSYWTLLFMWLKFSAIWRFFRLWALAGGVTAPENMGRCVNNNYDAEGFWRTWHASFNRWLVRYAYLPLGGAAWRALNVWPIFVFVALWHDPATWRLLGWAAGCALFLAPELAAKRLARSAALRPHQAADWYRHLCACGAALNISALMAANLVGFVVGLDGVGFFAQRLRSAAGARFAAATLATFFAAAQLMFEIRAAEARRAAARAAKGV